MTFRIVVKITQSAIQPGKRPRLTAEISQPDDEATSPTSAEQPPSQEVQKAQKLIPTLPNGDPCPLQGLEYREWIRKIRARALQDQMNGVDLSGSRLWNILCSGDGPRLASFHVAVPHTSITDLVTSVETGATIDLCIHAPSEYSQLDVVQICGELGYDFAAQSEGDNSTDDLEKAVLFHWLALNASYNDLDSRLLAFHELCTSLHQRFRSVFGPSVANMPLFSVDPGDIPNPSDLRQALSLLLSALDSCPVEHPRRLDLLINLAGWLQDGLHYCGLTDDLEAAVAWCRQHVLSELPQHAGLLNNFGYVFAYRFENRGFVEDQDAVLLLLREALKLTDVNDPFRVDCLYNLALQSRMRYRNLRHAQDREEAFRYCRDALDLNAKGVGDISRSLLLLERGLICAEDEEVEEGLALFREAQSLINPNSISDRDTLVMILVMISRCLLSRFSQYESVQDLEEASSILNQALQATINSPGRRIHLLIDFIHVLSQARTADADRTNWFDKVIPMAQEALVIFGQHKARHIAHIALANALFGRFKVRRDVNDVVEAMSHATTAWTVITDGDGTELSHRARCLSLLARLHLDPGSPYFDISTGLQNLEECLDDEHCGARLRLNFIDQVLQNLDDETKLTILSAWAESFVRLHLKAIHLLPQVVYIGLNHKTRLRLLRVWDSVIQDTSILCLLTERHAEAIEIIEEGKTLFWSQVLQLRTPVDDLPDDLRNRLRVVFRQLEDDGRSSLSTSRDTLLEAARRRRSGEELSALLKEARTLPGYEHFMLHPPLSTLVNCAKYGPVVLLIPHGKMCVAHCIIPTGPDSQTCRPVQLKEITRVGIQRWSKNLQMATATNRSASPSHDDPEREESHARSDRAGRAVSSRKVSSEQVLKEMWLLVVKPIFDAIGLKPSSGRNRPRIWWCTTGEFTFIPVHAAGIYSQSGQCCSDYVVSSYTPTLGTLISAREGFERLGAQHNAGESQQFNVLPGGVPFPYRGEPLPGVITELKAVASVIPPQLCLRLPPGEDLLNDPKAEAGASAQTILDMLPEASVLHLACHGVQNADSPLDSGFIMRDGMLTISKLMPLSLPRAMFAYLSACETAKGDDSQPNQPIHLAATLLFAGFKSVVGTLWLMDDTDGARVAKAIYEHLFADFKSEHKEEFSLHLDTVPYALDDAIQELRASGLPPSRWAQYIHLGM